MRESIVQLILFIALVSVTAVTVGTIVSQAGSLADSIDGESDRRADALDADVTIVNDPATTAYDPNASGGDGGVVLYVKNVGDATLEPGSLDVLLDGAYASRANTTALTGDRWRAGTVLRVTIPTDLDPGTHRVLVRLFGSEDRLTFEHN